MTLDGLRPLSLTRLLVLALSVALAAALSACGGDGGSEPSSVDRSSSSSARDGEPSAPGDPVGDRQSGQPDKEQPQGSKQADKPPTEGGASSGEAANTVRQDRRESQEDKGETAGIDRSAGSCPSTITREQCLENARASARDTPSYVVSEPDDCLKAMSRADCEAMIEQEQAATASSGPSFSPEECLRYYTREECEATLRATGQTPK